MVAQATLNEPGLEDFLTRHAGNFLYFNQGWLKVITSLYGYTLIQLTTKNSKGHITGYLPLCYLQSALRGRRLVSLPFADYCPLLADDETSAHDLVDQALRLAKEKHVNYLELRAGLNETLSQRDDLVKGSLYGRCIVPLDPNPDVVWSGFRKSVHRNVRKAQRYGVQVKVAQTREDILAYYRLHLLTRAKKHGMPAQPLKFFLRLWETLTPLGMLRVELAEYEGKVVAGAINGTYDQTVQFLYGASDEQYNHLAANSLLTWESLRWSCLNGYQRLDQGRTSYDNTGLLTYKRTWGGYDEPLPYYYYPAVRGLAATPESSSTYKLLTRYWRKLPLSLAGPLGSMLYRHLG